MICASGEAVATAGGEVAAEAMALVVRDYSQSFETPGGRRRKGAAPYVALPTRHDGKRFRRVAKLERGAEVYAAWCLILAVAARCPRRGVLMDERGEALTAEDLSDMTGFPREVFEMGIAALLDERIGWLEQVPIRVIEEEAVREAVAAELARAALPGSTGSTGMAAGMASGSPSGVASPVLSHDASQQDAGLGPVSPAPVSPAPVSSGPVLPGPVSSGPAKSQTMSPAFQGPQAASAASTAGSLSSSAQADRDLTVTVIDRLLDPDERFEQWRLEENGKMLMNLGINDKVDADLCRLPHVMPNLIRFIWKKASKENGVKARIGAFERMIRQSV